MEEDVRIVSVAELVREEAGVGDALAEVVGHGDKRMNRRKNTNGDKTRTKLE